ncbi:MAG: HNH endonuclease [Clostridia bacterium]|nr:HNH endonuclease [Clostridia bacterium]
MTKSNEEIWKPIKDYENLYEISNFGVIRKVKTKRPLKVFYRTNGYYTTSLCKNYKVTMIYLHRIIAETFIPNPNNLPCINHKDGNKTNNDLSNLEWCTYSDNNRHAYETGLKNCKKVAQYDIDGNLINIYNSVINASKETNISQANISSCALGKRNKAGGFIWKYLESKGE